MRKLGQDPSGAPEETKETGTQDGKKKRGAILSWIVIAAAAVVLVIALFNIIGISGEDMASENVYSKFKEAAQPSAQAGAEAAGPLDRKIDFDALREMNGDIVGWIYITNSEIDYPVLQAADNDYYISHSADREENRAGAIFLDYQNAPDFSDRNTIIYGHRMNNGSMFADLHKFEDEAFFRENDIIYLYLPDGTVRQYKVFAAFVAGDVDDVYTIGFGSDEAYADYLTKMQGRSGVKTDFALSADDNIITLSTCVRGEESKRYVVQAILQQ